MPEKCAGVVSQIIKQLRLKNTVEGLDKSIYISQMLRT